MRKKVRDLIKETRSSSPEKVDNESQGGLLKHPNLDGLLNRRDIDNEIKGLPAHLMRVPEDNEGLIAEEREKYRDFRK